MIIRIFTIPLFFYFFSLIVFLLVQRPLFIFYNKRAEKCSFTYDVIKRIYHYGIKTDYIACAFLSIIPILATVAQCFIPTLFLPYALRIYCIFVGLFLSLIILGDTILYRYWRYKIDSSVLPYLKSLKGVFASVSNSYIFVMSVVLLIFWGLITAWLILGINLGGADEPFIASGKTEYIYSVLLSILLIGLCELVIRGLGRRPKNPAIAFFSETLFFNHCALNPTHNFLYSFTVNDKFDGVFNYFSAEECQKEFKKLFPGNVSHQPSLLTTDRPNILFIIWESLSARFIESLGGTPGVTPEFDRLAKEGILFSHVDASGNRTDKGIVALLSGYPAQPTTTLIRMTRKLPNLPSLPMVFKDLGYTTTILHGGDLSIFHKKEYYLTIGHDRAVTILDFPKDSPQGKWGVHDGVTMDWLYEEIMRMNETGEKWFITYQTLSSHETWEVPYSRLLPQQPVENAFAYVDHEFGKLIDKLKESDAWKDLLIVVSGDHGCNMCEPIERSKYPHIPMLLLGGAVRKPEVVDTIMSQTDLAATLLGQLGLPSDQFIFSRDIFSPTNSYNFSFHSFQNGYMFRDATGFTVVDTTVNQPIENPDDERWRKGKVILQTLYKNISKL